MSFQTRGRHVLSLTVTNKLSDLTFTADSLHHPHCVTLGKPHPACRAPIKSAGTSRTGAATLASLQDFADNPAIVDMEITVDSSIPLRASVAVSRVFNRLRIVDTHYTGMPSGGARQGSGRDAIKYQFK